LENRFFSGVIPSDAVEVQVSINGSEFSSDPSLSEWGDGKWTVPNSQYSPEGLELLTGVNTVEVRTLLPSGSLTPPAKAEVTLKSVLDLGVVAIVPTNIAVVQNDGSITLSAEPGIVEGQSLYESEIPPGFVGINVYASQFAGGGSTGYLKATELPIQEGEKRQETAPFGSLTVDVDAAVSADGAHLADPMFFRLVGTQENNSEVTLQSDFNQKFEIPEGVNKMKMATSVSTVRDVIVYSFTHLREAGPAQNTVRVGAWAAMPVTSPLYYVVTGVYYDAASNTEYESSYSEEVVAHPLQVTTALSSMPSVSRQSIVQSYIRSVFRSNPQVKVEPGSVLRDTVIDPFSGESERLRFIFDFFQRARTPSLLLQVDDPTNSGTSVSVASSPYKQALKQALYLGSDPAVQALIDSSFNSMANNFGLIRNPGTRSAGEVTFYTTSRPSSSLNIPLGTTVSGGPSTFSTLKGASIPINNLAAFYDPVSGRYKVTVPVRATSPGAAGNLGSGQVTGLVSAIGSLRVVNEGAMTGGSGRESNLALSTRIMNTLASVDSGTERGYLQTAADTPGVVQAQVVAAGNPLMLRDLNAEGQHMGGKVDIWVQGTNTATLTDAFAFTFDIMEDVQFEVLGDPSEYTFKAVDPALSQSSPIVEMLNYPNFGLKFQNVSTGETFDLTDVAYPTYNTIKLSTDVVQPLVDLTDVCLGSYRRRTASKFTLPRQPVSSISSVTGEVSGVLPSSAYYLAHPFAPLGQGRSALAGDFLQVVPYVNAAGVTIPSGNLLAVEDEAHVLIGSYPEFLEKLGAVYFSIVVTSEDGLTTYRGPDDPSGDPDYTVTLGTNTTAVSLTRTTTGNIPSGTPVLVSYSHDENFSVSYASNQIVSQTQLEVDADKHATADVLVKEAVPLPVDIEATLVLVKGRVASTVDTSLRTNLANFFNNLRLGDPVRQSDIIDVMEQTDGVSYVVVPLPKLVPSPDALIVREELDTDIASESTSLSALSTNTAITYILNNPLMYATSNGGGGEGVFKAVFQNDVGLTLLEGSVTLESLGEAPGNAYIIGNGGASISGFSDDATLSSQGYTTSTAIVNRRKELTANHVLISLPPGQSPTSYNYACTYGTVEDIGAKNFDPGEAQFCSAGVFTFTYDEDQ